LKPNWPKALSKAKPFNSIIMSDKSPTYSEAIATIDEILEQIETGELDVDELASRVKQATDLLKLCKGKLYNTSKEIEKVLKDMENEKE
jgi:exodeoxyribonuclease VII small subunit